MSSAGHVPSVQKLMDPVVRRGRIAMKAAKANEVVVPNILRSKDAM